MNRERDIRPRAGKGRRALALWSPLLFPWLLLVWVACAPQTPDGLPRDREAGEHRTSPQRTSPQRISPQRIGPGELAALLDPVFAQGMAEEHIPGAAFVLVQDGRVVMAKGYGVADVESRKPVDPRTTIFPIASISKVFTATAVMQLFDRGRLDLHADVNRYLTSLQVPDTYPRPITAADLLQHTSGLDELPGRRVKRQRTWCRWANFSRTGSSAFIRLGR